MIEIKDLLRKWDSVLTSGETKKESVRKIISEVIGIQIKKEDLEIKNNIIYLNIKPIYKNEILLKKDKISSRLQDYFGKRAPGIR